jgi:multidrug transporter EmrE-like cation transporter
LAKPEFSRVASSSQDLVSPEARQLLADGADNGELVHLNRLLLEEAFPNEVLKKQAPASPLNDVFRLVGRGISNHHILLGVFFEALFFIALLMLMSKADVSFVWPLTSLSFVVTTFAAKVYLHEHVSALRWSGVALIMLGAGLITWTEKHHGPRKDVLPVNAPVAHSSQGQ